MDIFNTPWLYIFVAVIIGCVLLQTIIMMRKAWKHAQHIGYSNSQIRKALINGFAVSVIPTIPVLVVFLTLVPLLGAPLPWLRLSVIGSASFESMAAGMGIEAVGETMTVGGITVLGWLGACWVMSLAGSVNIVWGTFGIKPVHKLYSMAEKVNMKLVIVIGTGCLAGVMAMAAVEFGLASMSTSGVVFLSSFILGAVLIGIYKKFPAFKWIHDFLMIICMIFGMCVATIVL